MFSCMGQVEEVRVGRGKLVVGENQIIQGQLGEPLPQQLQTPFLLQSPSLDVTSQLCPSAVLCFLPSLRSSLCNVAFSLQQDWTEEWEGVNQGSSRELMLTMELGSQTQFQL